MVDCEGLGEVQLSARQSLVELVERPEADLGTDSWWSCVARHLDRLNDDLDHEDIVGLVEQVTAELPEWLHLAARVRRRHESVRAEAGRLRLVVAERAGSREAAVGVRDALEALLAQVRRAYRLADGLLLDAYSLDIGGGD